MLQEMQMVLDNEARASRIFCEMVSLQASTPIDPADQGEKMVGEEFYEFWPPDEILRIEDVFGDDKTPVTGFNSYVCNQMTFKADLPYLHQKSLTPKTVNLFIREP